MSNYADEVLNSFLNQPKPPPVAVKQQVNEFVFDEARADVLRQQQNLISELFSDIPLPDYIRDSLTVNASTSTIQRQAPTREQKIKALWSFWDFVDLIGFHGASIAFSECHRELMAWKLAPERSFRTLVLEARGMLKSTLLCVAYTLWRIYQNPNIRLFVGTESLKLSKAFIREIEVYLTDEFLVEHVWNARPHFDGPLIPVMDSVGKQRRRSLVKDISSEFGDEFDTQDADKKKKVWRAEAIQVVRTRKMKEPTVVAGSVGQTSTGFHFDELIFDDVHTFKNTSSESMLEKVFSWIYDMESVLDPAYVDMDLVGAFHRATPSNIKELSRWAISGGRLSVIGTRYDEADYYSHIIDNKDALNFEVHIKNIYRNGVDDTDGYRWPEKWNKTLEDQIKTQFERKYGTKGLQRYYSQYHNRIVNPEESALNWDKIQWIHPAQVVQKEDEKHVTIFNLDGTVRWRFRPRLVVDPASTSGDRSDFTAMAVGGVVDGCLIIIDFWMKKEKVENWLEVLYAFVAKWNLHEVLVEMVGGFKVLEHTITQMWVHQPDKYRPIAVRAYNPPTNESTGKADRIETSLSPVLHAEKLYMPNYVARNSELRKQFLFFGKSTVKNDGPDVLAILNDNPIKMKIDVNKKKNPSQMKVVNPMHGGVDYVYAA